MIQPEGIEQLLVADPGRIEHHLHGLGMTRAAGGNFLVARVLLLAADVAGGGGHHARRRGFYNRRYRDPDGDEAKGGGKIGQGFIRGYRRARFPDTANPGDDRASFEVSPDL